MNKGSLLPGAKDFVSFLIECALESLNLIGVSVAIASFAFTLYVIPENQDISLKSFVGLVFIFLCVAAILLHAARRAFYKEAIGWPSVISVFLASSIEAPPGIIILLSPSLLFDHGALVAVYKSGEMEELVAIGHVKVVQEDGRIQILLHTEKVDAEKLEGIRQQLSGYLPGLTVKSIVPIRGLQGHQMQGVG